MDIAYACFETLNLIQFISNQPNLINYQINRASESGILSDYLMTNI